MKTGTADVWFLLQDGGQETDGDAAVARESRAARRRPGRLRAAAEASCAADPAEAAAGAPRGGWRRTSGTPSGSRCRTSTHAPRLPDRELGCGPALELARWHWLLSRGHQTATILNMSQLTLLQVGTLPGRRGAGARARQPQPAAQPAHRRAAARPVVLQPTAADRRCRCAGKRPPQPQVLLSPCACCTMPVGQFMSRHLQPLRGTSHVCGAMSCICVRGIHVRLCRL